MVNTGVLAKTGFVLLLIASLSIVSTLLLFGTGLVLSYFGLPGLKIVFSFLVIAFFGFHARHEYNQRYDGGSVIKTAAVSIVSLILFVAAVFVGMFTILFVFSFIGYGFVGWWIHVLITVGAFVYLVYAGIYRPIRDHD